MRRYGPVFVLFALAPLVAELLFGATPVSRIGGLLPESLLYGGGAVLIRELARRRGGGWGRIALLGAAYAIGQALYFPLMFISNLFVPATQLPAWVAQVARFTPAYLLVDLLRPAFIPLIPTTQAAWLDALGLAVYAVVGLALFVRFFSWAPRG